MNGRTHLMGGCAVGVAALGAAAPSLSIAQSSLLVGAAAIGSLLPDIDLQTSKAGHALRPASFLIQHIFGHRTLFHSPILYLWIYFMLRIGLPQYNRYWYYALLGVASHLALDMLNSKGIPLFYPYTKRFHIASFSVNGLAEHLIQLGLGCIIAVQFFH